MFLLEKRKASELNNTKSALEEAIEFLRKHPENTNVGVEDKHNSEAYEDRTAHFRKTYNRKDYAPNRRNKFIPEQVGNMYEILLVPLLVPT